MSDRLTKERAYQRVKDVKDRVVDKVKEVEHRARQSDRKRTRAYLYLWRLVVQTVRQWKSDRCPQLAAGLAYQLLLSIVPAMAVAFAMFRFTGAMEAESSLVSFLSSELLPLSREEISERLIEWSDRISIETVGTVGLLTTMVFAFVLFNSLEHSVNHIWRVDKRRSLPRRFLAFLATFALAPLMVGTSMYYAARFGLTYGISGIFLSPLVTFAGLFLLNYMIPSVPVRVRPALVGAAVNTLAVEVAKFAFTLYVANFAMDRYSGIYGTLAIVPLLLIWVYWSWLMLLLGVEITHIVQNFGLLEGSDARRMSSVVRDQEKSTNAATALAFLREIAAHAHGLTEFELSQRADLSDDAVRAICHRLQHVRLLCKSADGTLWQLMGQPEDIGILEVLDAFSDGDGLRLPVPVGTSSEAAVLRELIEGARERAEGYSIADLQQMAIAGDGQENVAARKTNT